MDLNKTTDKLILALDGLEQSEAFSLVKSIPNLIWVKVGLELFTANGPEVLTKLRAMNKRIFLDLKFHDIPNTMAAASFRAAKRGAELITVHACAGEKALIKATNAAIRGAEEGGLPPPTLLAVTVLTSWSSQKFLDELSIDQPIDKRVEHLAALASRAGIGGCICSPWEVQNLRRIYPKSFQLITPGIRFKENAIDDQSRVMSPLGAIQSGASKLVLGRMITCASNPSDAFQRVCTEITNGSTNS